MKRQNKKRGFTIIELVIVVAVIAILSAVLIPTFSAVIKKSKESADQSAVRNMNTILKAEEADSVVTITDLYEILDENGISAKNYKPLYNDRFFFWDKEENVILYTNDEYEVLYPADQKDNTNVENWITLSGEIKEAEFKEVTIENKTATVDSPSELIALANAWNDKEDKNYAKAHAVTNIVLPAGDFNLMGAELNFEGTMKNFTFGAEDGKTTTIKGFVDYKAVNEHRASAGSGAIRNYNAGMFATLGANTTIKNIVIDGAIVGDSSLSIVGVIAGYVSNTVTIDNVQVKNTTVYGMQKVGGLIGYLAGKANVTISNTTMENVTVKATMGLAGGIFGYLQAGKVTVDNVDATVGNTKVELVKASTGHYIDYARTEDGLLDTTISVDLNEDFTVNESELGQDVADCYRYFASCAKYGFVKGGATEQLSGLKGYQNQGVCFAYNAKAAMPTNGVFTPAA